MDEHGADRDAAFGQADAGLRQLFAGLNPERIMAAAFGVGLGRHALGKAVAYAKERTVWGGPVGAHQGVAHPLAQVHIELELAALMTREAAARYDAGEALPVHDSWRIEENRWAAMRDGVEGSLADLETGERVPTRELLRSRVSDLHPTTEALITANGAVRTRSVGVDGAARYLADQFLD